MAKIGMRFFLFPIPAEKLTHPGQQVFDKVHKVIPINHILNKTFENWIL